jgi:hypothetical protein
LMAFLFWVWKFAFDWAVSALHSEEGRPLDFIDTIVCPLLFFINHWGMWVCYYLVVNYIYQDGVRVLQVLDGREPDVRVLQYCIVAPLNPDVALQHVDMRWDALAQIDIKHSDPLLCAAMEIKWVSELAAKLNHALLLANFDPEPWLSYWRRTVCVVVSMELFSQMTVPSAMDAYLDEKDVLERLRLIARTTQTINMNRMGVLLKQDVVQNTLNMAMCYWCERRPRHDLRNFFLHR